jgi:hypothetical protein
MLPRHPCLVRRGRAESGRRGREANVSGLTKHTVGARRRGDIVGSSAVPGFEVRFCVPPTDGVSVERGGRIDGWMDVGIG